MRLTEMHLRISVVADAHLFASLHVVFCWSLMHGPVEHCQLDVHGVDAGVGVGVEVGVLRGVGVVVGVGVACVTRVVSFLAISVVSI